MIGNLKGVVLLSGFGIQIMESFLFSTKALEWRLLKIFIGQVESV